MRVVYVYAKKKKKDAPSASGVKKGSRDLRAVGQRVHEDVNLRGMHTCIMSTCALYIHV